jgi:uncharacterized protein YjbI with pentapeptide repeats
MPRAAKVTLMATLHESIDFVGKSQLPRGWEDDVYRYCTFASLDLEGKAFEGVLCDCVITSSAWYWGLFNTTRFVAVEFRDCIFRGSAFAGCIFANCRFVNCTFAEDNLSSGCSFTDCQWYSCAQVGCSGLPEEHAAGVTD